MSKTQWIIGGVAVLIIIILYFALDARSKSAEGKSDISFTNSQTGTQTASDTNTKPMDNTQQAGGLQIQTETAGTGDGAKAGDTVTVQYTGTLTNGQKFDSSYDHGQPFTFKLGAGSVIKGWDQGLIGMKVGEKRKLTIPSELGYGPNANGPIPANSTLIFEVEMVKITH